MPDQKCDNINQINLVGKLVDLLKVDLYKNKLYDILFRVDCSNFKKVIFLRQLIHDATVYDQNRCLKPKYSRSLVLTLFAGDPQIRSIKI
jgi:hypothetical protein